jgi:hypothetical protein
MPLPFMPGLQAIRYARLHLGGDLLLGAGADVLALGDDPVVREEEVDLGDLGALVLDVIWTCPAGNFVVDTSHLESVAVTLTTRSPPLGIALLGAARDSGQRRRGGGGGDDGESNGSHTGSKRVTGETWVAWEAQVLGEAALTYLRLT